MIAAGLIEEYAGLINYNRGETSVAQDGYLNLVLHQTSTMDRLPAGSIMTLL